MANLGVRMCGSCIPSACSVQSKRSLRADGTDSKGLLLLVAAEVKGANDKIGVRKKGCPRSSVSPIICLLCIGNAGWIIVSGGGTCGCTGCKGGGDSIGGTGCDGGADIIGGGAG